MKSSSLSGIKAIAEFIRNTGYNPREYRDILIHEWYLNPLIAEKLDVFIQRKIHAADIFHKVKDGELFLGQRTYSVVWVSKPETIRKEGWALASFRWCPNLNTGYVLLKVLKDSQNTDFEEIKWHEESLMRVM